MNRKQKILLALLLASICAVLLAFGAMAEEDHGEIVRSGECGDNLTWTLYEDGLMEISGTGEMWDYGEDWNNGAPWRTNSSCRRIYKTLKLNEGITAIGDYAFYDSFLKGGLEFPDSLERIGNGSFENQVFLTGDLIISDNVTTIGYKAFYSNSGFKGILKLPERIVNIGNNAFGLCAFSGDLVIPDSVEYLGEGAFLGCDFDGILKIGNGIDTIKANTFSSCKTFTGDLVIPEGIKVIEKGAFKDSGQFSETLYIPKSVEVIQEEAFMRCEWMKSVDFAGDNPCQGDVFGRTWRQSELTLYYDADSKGFYYDWNNYKCRIKGFGDLIASGTDWNGVYNEIEDDYVDSWMHCAIYENGVLEVGGEGVLVSSRTMEAHQGEISSIIIRDGFSEIGSDAFSRWYGLTGTLVIPDSVVRIDKGAFNECKSIVRVIIGDGVCEIDDWAFGNCDYLSSLSLGKSVMTIGAYAFYNNKIQSLVFPDTLKALSKTAFQSYGLCNVYFAGDAPECEARLETDIYSGSFSYCENVILYYLEGAEGWTTPEWRGYPCYPVNAIPEPEPFVAVKGITLDCTEVALDIYDGVLLTAAVNPGDATAPYIIWTSSDESVVTVDRDGWVNTVGEGIAYVTAKTIDGNYTATCTVTVTEVERAKPGDVNGDDKLDSNDAIYLLRHTMNKDRYPITQSGDVNGDGSVDSDDAIYLLRHTMNPERYPLS